MGGGAVFDECHAPAIYKTAPGLLGRLRRALACVVVVGPRGRTLGDQAARAGTARRDKRWELFFFCMECLGLVVMVVPNALPLACQTRTQSTRIQVVRVVGQF